MTHTTRINRIPRQRAPLFGWCRRLHTYVKRLAARTRIAQLENALDVLHQHMGRDEACAFNLRVQGRRSPTLNARRASDAALLADLTYRLHREYLLLGELEAQP